MFHHLLVALDGSESAQKALARAIEMSRITGATLGVVSVVEDLPHMASRDHDTTADLDSESAHFRNMHEDAKARARRDEVELTAEIRRGPKTNTLIEAVRSFGTDLLVVGSAGHSGPFARFLGGTTAQLVAHAPTSVLVVRPHEWGRRFNRLLVAVDGSESSRGALRVADKLRTAFSGTLNVLLAVAAANEAATIEEVRNLVAGCGIREDLSVTRGHPVQAILEYADDMDADLVVLGAVGLDHRRPVEIGGTSHRVADLSQRSVLIVR
jgi:nucleotide-binding universal stress UspA family protein